MTFAEKERNFTALLNASAAAKGCRFIQDSGEGRDLETGDLYLEDVSGWLVPLHIPTDEEKQEKYYCFAEWRELGDGKFAVEFVSHG